MRRAGHSREVAVLAEQFDVVVLGGGPAGYATALYGAAAGLDVALVEETRVGGTCLHRGCIPAKELLQTAEVLRTIQRAPDFGVDAGVPSLDLARSQARKREVIDRLTKGLESLLKGRKVTVFDQRGEVVDAEAHRVRLADGTEVSANLVLATGSYPRSLPRLDFDGARVLSSDHVLELEKVPPRVAIIGGGVIGAEFASMLADMGSEVTIIEALPRILAATDVDAGNVVARSFKKRGIGVHTSARVTGIEGATELTVTWETDARVRVRSSSTRSSCRSAAARSGGIGLEESGVEIDDRGFVVVDEQLRTGVAGCVRGRRRGRHACTRPRGVRRGRRDREDDHRRVGHARSTTARCPGSSYSHPEVALVRSHRGAGTRRGPRRRGQHPPVRRRRPGDDPGRHRGAREDGRRRATARCSACTSRARGPPSCSARATSASTGRPTPPTSRR